MSTYDQAIANLRAEHDRLMALKELEHRNLMDAEERRVNLGIMTNPIEEKLEEE